ncbi:zinc ABC transporter substrate-binding protein [Leisingera methylohalidivorans]|uniref:High-affinity zinc uptake system protein ZnuA n=1 Tax=Leisingera methylohalidivorans DSM 14336 TaxID=999552 RepID=V9W359_9RHOB|nr:zinc ABC transporter substrate-binding protein [Leisingera methylohalidivorans]AHD03602.1 zinc transporter [Leisingera methylohalidivorans DSM 14336]
MWKNGAAVVALLAGAGTGAAWAEVPRVAADITPVHGLVARVMQGLGAPDLVVPPGASPHGYSMRPSEARALDQADVVFWLGEPLTPWLEGPLEKLAGDAHRVELLQAEGTTVLAFREGARFEAHAHEDAHGEHGGHADPEGRGDQDGHREEGHEDHADHEAHAGGEGGDGHEGHDHQEHGEAGHDDHHDDHHDEHEDHEAHAAAHGHEHHGADPHAWLLPANAQVWLDVIAAELSEHDPDNAAAYKANAEAGKQEIADAAASISAVLEPFQARQFIVFHDAYQYFEQGFGLQAAGAISLSDASTPSPARIAEVRDAVAELEVSCVFSEPQFNPGLAATVLDGTGAGTAVLDPLGAGLEPGPQFYPALLQSLGAAIAGC